jgi:hypothetical protein
MHTEEELNEKIMKLTMVIEENYPELTKYLSEMPVANPTESNPEINRQELSKYYDTLVSWFRGYVTEQQLQNSNRTYTDHHL